MKPYDVVSNTSPLIFLEKTDSLHLLENCFRSIHIPESVKNEWGIKTIPSFISVHPLSEFGKSDVRGAIGRLHKGELEAIQLAIELNQKIVLLDDLLARRFAERMGLAPLGVLGIFKISCKIKLLTPDEVRIKISELVHHHGMFISPKILEQYFDSF